MLLPILLYVLSLRFDSARNAAARPESADPAAAFIVDSPPPNASAERQCSCDSCGPLSLPAGRNTRRIGQIKNHAFGTNLGSRLERRVRKPSDPVIVMTRRPGGTLPPTMRTTYSSCSSTFIISRSPPTCKEHLRFSAMYPALTLLRKTTSPCTVGLHRATTKASLQSVNAYGRAVLISSRVVPSVALAISSSDASGPLKWNVRWIWTMLPPGGRAAAGEEVSSS